MVDYVFLALSVPGATFCVLAIGYSIRNHFHERVARHTQS